MNSLADLTIAIDLDGTISEESYEDYIKLGAKKYVKSRKPFAGVVATINELYSKQVKIIFYTARDENLRSLTEQWLKKHNIQHHQLLMNRPKADIYLNDRAFPLNKWIWSPEIAKQNLSNWSKNLIKKEKEKKHD